MNSVALILRAVLVVVFATAAVAKLADLSASSDTVEAFGVRQPVARYFGTALPCGELITALLLLFQPTARWGAVAAVLLLVVFNGGVAYALSQGRTPDCNCFGQVSSEQISWRTLARNGVLIVIAAVAVWKAPGSSFSAWTTNHVAADVTASVAVLAAVLLMIAAFHFRGRAQGVHATADESAAGDFGDALQAGTQAPDFDLEGRDGSRVTRDSLLARGLPVVLIFASPTCGPCHAMMPEVGRWNDALGDSLTIAVVESGVDDPTTFASQLGMLKDVPVLFEPQRELAEQYKARATPTGVAISPSGRISSPPLPGRDQIESLIRTMLQTGGEAPTAPPLAGSAVQA